MDRSEHRTLFVLLFKSKHSFTRTNYIDKKSVVIIAGGTDGDGKSDTILEFDITGDSIKNIGRMREARGYAWRGVSVVKTADFSHWWVCP